MHKLGTANGNRTRILALKGLRANRCTIAALCCGVAALLEYGKLPEATSRGAAEITLQIDANDGLGADYRAPSAANKKAFRVRDAAFQT